ncbi:hypothetical protein NE865_09910 [Phthorimaea operculella]|nr:hypothetical protein NE865_09910 [Phthorimaea operculella]
MDNAKNFLEYVSSQVNLDTLEKLTDDMDKDIEESQKLMDEIKAVINTIPSRAKVSTDSGLRHEDISNFLEAEGPKLMPDMCDSVMEIDLDDVIVTMKSYAEELNKIYVAPEPKTVSISKQDISSLELDQYAFSLDQLSKRLANIKLTKKEEVNNRNPELESKLTQLCEDVNHFTQMVQAKTKLTECNKNWAEPQQHSSSLQYSDVITKLLSGVNEVIYLLQNTN